MGKAAEQLRLSNESTLLYRAKRLHHCEDDAFFVFKRFAVGRVEPRPPGSPPDDQVGGLRYAFRLVLRYTFRALAWILYGPRKKPLGNLTVRVIASEDRAKQIVSETPGAVCRRVPFALMTEDDQAAVLNQRNAATSQPN